jgi:hypothetical protein
MLAAGFPPHTAIDSAEALGDWQVIGMDRALFEPRPLAPSAVFPQAEIGLV